MFDFLKKLSSAEQRYEHSLRDLDERAVELDRVCNKLRALGSERALKREPPEHRLELTSEPDTSSSP